MSFAVAADAVQTTVSSYTMGSGSMTIASVPSGMPTPSSSAPILVTAVRLSTYGTSPETFCTYLCTGLTGTTLTGLTVVDGSDNSWVSGDIVEMRYCAKHINDLETAVQTSILTVNSEASLPDSRKLTAGSNITLTDNGAGSTLVISASGGSGGSPGGSNGQIQYNESSSFGGFTMSGDATIVTSTGVLTLATVNSNTGTFGSSTAIPSVTVNAKGLITAVTTDAVVAPAGTLSGTTLNSTVVTSSLTSVGTIGAGTWQGTVVGATYGGTGVNNGSSTITIGGNVTFSGSHTFTGTLSANTAVTFPTSGTLVASPVPLSSLATQAAYTVLGNITSGSATPTAATEIIVGAPAFSDTGVYQQWTSSVSGYAQLILNNTSSGSSASTDIVVNNNNGTASAYYGDFGINSSNFSGSGSLQLPNAVYLYSESGDLVLGTNTSNAVHFVIANGSSDAMTIGTDGGITVGSPTGGDKGAGTINATGLYVNGTAVGGGGSGTVTSVALSMPSNFSVSGSPITSSGTLAITANTPNVQVFTSSGTYTVPTGATFIRVLAIGPGGGGGGGGVAASGTAIYGGGGGSGGSFVDATFRAADLTSTVTVTVASAGSGGSGASSSGGSGSGGSGSGNTTFGSYCTASGGANGGGGSTSSGTGGGLTTEWAQGGAGSSSSVTGNAGAVSASFGIGAAAGGGGGGGISSGGTAYNGGNGFYGLGYTRGGYGSGGSSGGSAGGGGTTSTSVTDAVSPGGSGGGGGAVRHGLHARRGRRGRSQLWRRRRGRRGRADDGRGRRQWGQRRGLDYDHCGMVIIL